MKTMAWLTEPLSGLEYSDYAVNGVSIAGRAIGAHMPPYMVAELSCNHNGSIDRAKEMIAAAADAGADAVKLQTYTPAELTTPEHNRSCLSGTNRAFNDSKGAAHLYKIDGLVPPTHSHQA